MTVVLVAAMALQALSLEDEPAASPSGPALTRADIHLRGNQVLPDEVYLAVLSLPPDAIADNATAAWVHDQILGFLIRAGYELAQVRVTATNGGLDVDIDEGQLEK